MQSKSLRKTAVSSIAWTFAQQFSSQIIAFFLSIIMARVLLPEEFGLIGMVMVFINLGQSLKDGGLTQSLIRTENPTQDDYSTVFHFNLAGSILIYLLIFFAAPFIADFYNQEILVNIIRLYGLTIIISGFTSIQLTRLTKEMNFKTQMVISVPSLVISGLLGIYLAYSGYGVWSLVWSGIAQALINSAQLWWYGKWSPSFTFSKEKFNYHFSFGYKMTLTSILNTVFTNIYQILIGRFFIASQVGFYTRASSVRQLPVTNLSKALDKVTYPLFATIQNDDVRLKRAYKEIMQMVIFIVAPVLIFMAALGEPLFRFLFTEKWLPAVPYFQVLCIAGILFPIHSYNLNILRVKGRSDLFLKLEVVKKILIIATILVSFQFGIMGLVWGQVFTSVASLFINTYYSGKFINYTSWDQLRDMFPIVVFAAFAGGIILIIDHQMHAIGIFDFYRLIIGGSIGVSLFLGLSWFFTRNVIDSFKRIILRKS